MGRPKTRPPKQPADPVHVSEMRRAAAAASAKARRERSINGGRRPKTLPVRAATFDKVQEVATRINRTLTDITTEAIEHGLPYISANA